MSGRQLLQRATLVITGLTPLMLGVWNTVSPRSFYNDFPGAGHHWVSPDGPYNEHLLRDVGALSLALAVLIGAALIVRSVALVRTAALGGIAFGFPHFVYHASHTDLFSTGDATAELVALAIALIAPAIALATTFGAAAVETVS